MTGLESKIAAAVLRTLAWGRGETISFPVHPEPSLEIPDTVILLCSSCGNRRKANLEMCYRCRKNQLLKRGIRGNRFYG
jgi:hypothetical protein